MKLQYTHCRLISLEQNCGVTLPDNCDPSLLTEPEALDLVLEIARLDFVVNFMKIFLRIIIEFKC